MGGMNADPRKQAAAAVSNLGAQDQQIVLPPANRFISQLVANIPPAVLAALGMAPNAQATLTPNGAGTTATIVPPAAALPPTLAQSAVAPGAPPAAALPPALAESAPVSAATASNPAMATVQVSPLAAYIAMMGESGAGSGAGSGSGGAPDINAGNTSADASGGPAGAGGPTGA
jgi:hypothetical protein